MFLTTYLLFSSINWSINKKRALQYDHYRFCVFLYKSYSMCMCWCSYKVSLKHYMQPYGRNETCQQFILLLFLSLSVISISTKEKSFMNCVKANHTVKGQCKVSICTKQMHLKYESRAHYTFF